MIPEEYALPPPLPIAHLPTADDYDWYYYDGVDERGGCPPWEGYYLSERLSADSFFPLHGRRRRRSKRWRCCCRTNDEPSKCVSCERTACHHMTQSGSVGALRLLLGKVPDDEVPDLDAKDEDGLTALMIAASEGASDVVTELLARGADANIVEDTDGSTALHLAAVRCTRCCRPHGRWRAITPKMTRISHRCCSPPVRVTSRSSTRRPASSTWSFQAPIRPPLRLRGWRRSETCFVRALSSHMTSRNFVYPVVSAVLHASVRVVEALLQAGAAPCRRNVDAEEWKERREACATTYIPRTSSSPLRAILLASLPPCQSLLRADSGSTLSPVQ